MRLADAAADSTERALLRDHDPARGGMVDKIHEASDGKWRLGVFVARASGLSRRRSFEAVMAGRVRVGSRIVLDPSVLIDPHRETVRLDEDRLRPPQTPTVILLHKPKGVVCTRSDPHAKTIVMDCLPAEWRRLFPIGRLDRDSEGLVVLTDDGMIAQVLSHPRYEVRKRYRVWLKKPLPHRMIEQLLKGRRVGGERLAFDGIRLEEETGGSWVYDVTIHEGRKRHIRRLLRHVGRPVQRLMRLRLGPLSLGVLGPGEYRRLNEEETARLERFCRRRFLAAQHVQDRAVHDARKNRTSNRRRS